MSSNFAQTVQSAQTQLAQAFQHAQTGVTNFNTKHKDQEKLFGSAQAAISKGLGEFTKADAAFKNGDAKGAAPPCCAASGSCPRCSRTPARPGRPSPPC